MYVRRCRRIFRKKGKRTAMGWQCGRWNRMRVGSLVRVGVVVGVVVGLRRPTVSQ